MMKASCKLLDNNGLQQSQTLSMCKPSLINREKRLQLSNKHKYILGWLSHGDVLSNELIYHTLSLTKYTNQCNSLLSTNNIDSANNTWIKELVLNSIILCIGGTELVGSDTVFMVCELEAMCVEMLDGHCIVELYCRASTCKGSRVTQRVDCQQVERII